jgi:hypothetical protein
LSTFPANAKVEEAILDETSKYVGGPNEVAPRGGLEAKLLQTGFLIGEIIDASLCRRRAYSLRLRHRG